MPSPTPAAPARQRVDSIDLLRGIVMVVMLLDHAREFIHRDAFAYDPTDLTRTSLVVFATRWITHFCAPTFVLLAGTGAYLYGRRCTKKSELSRFLATRGLWLIAVELFVLRPLLFFNLDTSLIAMLQVIWAIGISMVILAALVHLPLVVITALGAAIVGLHNLLDPIQYAGWGAADGPAVGWKVTLWRLLHQPGPIVVDPDHGRIAVVMYPFLPWLGVMMLGYALGALYELDAARRRRILVAIGACAAALFVLLRAPELYGDPRPWSQQPTLAMSVCSFVNTQKYPPSLLYVLMTLGPAMLALAAIDGVSAQGLARPLVTLGRVPFFFYVLQWPLLHGIALLFGLFAHQPLDWQFQLPWNRQVTDPGSIGFSLPIAYLGWALALLVLLPLCAWFAGVKRRHRSSWLSYL